MSAPDSAHRRRAIGRNIRDRRRARRKSQAWLCEQLYTRFGLEVRYALVSDWETGHSEPNARQLHAIADALGRRVDDLLPSEES